MKLKLFFILSVLLISSTVFAYGILDTKVDTGEPIVWDSSQPIQYWLDPGDYGGLTNEEAHLLLQEAMRIWESVETANVPHFEFAGYLPEDVNESNYATYVQLDKCFSNELELCETEYFRELKTVIIFDDDGYILDNELCRIIPCGAKGSVGTYEQEDPYVIGNVLSGYAVFSTMRSTSPSEVVSLFVHELGHMLRLGHSSLNQQLLYELLPDDGLSYLLFLPSMEVSDRLSTSTSDSTGVTLNPDDIAGISVLYPSDNFSTSTASISGTVYKSDETEIEHVNVIARNINDPLCKAYSFVTGRYCTDIGRLSQRCLEDNGEYLIQGIEPGTYTIEVEEIDEDQNVLTLDSPLAGDAEFWNTDDAADEDPYEYTTITLAAGDAIEGIDIILNRSVATEDRVKYIPLDYLNIPAETSCTDSTTDYYALIGREDPNAAAEAPSGGGCSLILP